MATIQPELLELKQRVAKLEEFQQKLEARVIAAEKAGTWWRLFTATALPIVLAIFVAAWIQSGRFDEISKRIDSVERRIDRIEQRMDHIEQTNQQILSKLQEMSQRVEKR
ncbi:MAG: hypothetical protein HY314_00880 [Acidobacteria bacterium]|nr:hypothetical protein [Acidobacteriota bacterium]